jgi:hypothetical protein
MEKFKVGDKVQIVDSGRTYTTYDRMFKKLGFKNIHKNEFFQPGLVAEVFAIGEHESINVTLLALQAQDGSQCLISTPGVVKVVTTPTSDDKFNIIREFCDEVLSAQGISDKDIFKYLLNKVASNQ